MSYKTGMRSEGKFGNSSPFFIADNLLFVICNITDIALSIIVLITYNGCRSVINVSLLLLLCVPDDYKPYLIKIGVIDVRCN